MITQPDPGGHFGPYGGRYVPEILMAPIEELEAAYLAARGDAAFQSELAGLLRDYAGRPSPLTECHNLSAQRLLWRSGFSFEGATGLFGCSQPFGRFDRYLLAGDALM